MGKALSTDLRQRVVAAYNRREGTQAEVAARFGVGEASLRRWLRAFRKTGVLEPKVAERYGPVPKIEVVNMATLESLMSLHPDATNAELAVLFEHSAGVAVSASTISRAIAVLGWTRKKSASSQAKPTPRVSAIFVRNGPNGPQQ